MHYKEFKEAEKNKVKDIHYWANKCRKIQKTLKYNPDPNATVRHHLRDTEEQRKYNDEHYEYFGFNQDGTFEYGKYIVFVTKEEHHAIHSVSEETKKKMSDAQRLNWLNENTRNKHIDGLKKSWNDDRREIARAQNLGDNNPNFGKSPSDETRRKMSESIKASMTDDIRLKISEASKKNWQDDDYRDNISCKLHAYYSIKENRDKLSEAVKAGYTDEVRQHFREMYTGAGNPFYGKHHSDEAKMKIGEANRGDNNYLHVHGHTEESKEKIRVAAKAHRRIILEAYNEYKSNGGCMKWNDFQKYMATKE